MDRTDTPDVIEHETTETSAAALPDVPRPSPVPSTAPADALSMIERAAANPDVNVDKLERLVALQERMIERQARNAFFAAMRAAQQEMPSVLKDGKNDSTKSKFAKLETVSKAVNPIINKHGFALSYGTDRSHLDQHYCVTLAITHCEGFTKEYRADIPVDIAGIKGSQNKTLTHAFGSTISYGRRYLKLLAFDIVVHDHDDDGNSPVGREPGVRPAKAGRPTPLGDPGHGLPIINADKVNQIVKALARNDLSERSFCDYFGIRYVEHLAAADFIKAMSMMPDAVVHNPEEKPKMGVKVSDVPERPRYSGGGITEARGKR